ncbi:MAG: VWA domain-containing protein, partial [Acidobacteria bacterium]|nr:VWA domain-containing protein [Acidobacteriota bacterium]
MPTSLARLALILTLLAGQQQVFRSGTELVEVDVVVLDSTGRLVRGLTAADIELYDEGERQEVSTFSFVEVDPATSDTAGTVSAELGLSSSDTHRAAAVYLIVIDNLFTPVRMSSRTRASAREFVRDRMRPGDLAAVIHLGLTTGGVEFSASKDALLAAIDRRRGTAGVAGENPTPGVAPSGGGGDARAPVDADAEIAETLALLARTESHLLAATAEKTYEMLEVAAEYVA